MTIPRNAATDLQRSHPLPQMLRRPRQESQIAGSGSGTKAHRAATISIGIPTGSDNKMTGTRNSVAQTQKITASTITGINRKNSNNISINRSFPDHTHLLLFYLDRLTRKR